jgi:hypothetical protein
MEIFGFEIYCQEANTTKQDKLTFFNIEVLLQAML